MSLDQKAGAWQDEMLAMFIDPEDHFFYNELNKNLTVEQRRESRNNFIDGLAWSSNLLASCIINPTEKNLLIAEGITKFHKQLDLVNGAPGRFARSYRTTGGDKWIASETMPGYFYRDGQAKAGPIALTSATAAAYAATELPQALREDILSTYLVFMKDFVDNGFRILKADGEISDNGDMSISGFAGIINRHFVYAMCALASIVAIEMEQPDQAVTYTTAAEKAAKGMWSADMCVWLYTTAMGVWDWVNRLFGGHREKYSNDNLIYQLFSIWAYAPSKGLLKGEARDSMTKAVFKMRDMTRTWENPFFDGIFALLGGKYHVVLDGIKQNLISFNIERRKDPNAKTPKGKDIVPIGERKPSSWAWRQNPYEQYLTTGFVDDDWYSPADFITAYNIYKYLSVV